MNMTPELLRQEISKLVQQYADTALAAKSLYPVKPSYHLPAKSSVRVNCN